jgi:selenocysteine-specific elongation factor
MASNIVIKSIFKMVESDVNPSKLLNINVGVLGHIDSGKTSLCKALSTIASTAGFDKSPQSKERGITLDLGFSAFVVPVP